VSKCTPIPCSVRNRDCALSCYASQMNAALLPRNHENPPVSTSLDPDKVCAVLVTRGDVNLAPILETLPYGEVVVYDNAKRQHDWKVFGRYVAISETQKPVIYFQDDDCLVTCHEELLEAYEPSVVVGNMLDHHPPRLETYRDTTLLGWGALFDRGLPFEAFEQYGRFYPIDWEFKTGSGAETVFPMLSRTKTIIEGIEWLDQDGPVFQRPNRMWKQEGSSAERDFWLDRAREVRDRITAGE